MSIRIPIITCLYCGDTISETKIEMRKIRVPGVARKQTVHNTDHCTLLNLGFKDVQSKRQNCYRRHQDFIKRLNTALESDNKDVRRFARKCLWQLLSRKPTKYLNQQLKSIKDPVDDEILFKKFRNFQRKPMVVLVR